MAKASKWQEVTYILELTQAEADVLREVCSRIGGTAKSRRGLMDNIALALDLVGVREVMSDDIDNTKDSSIYFIEK